MRDTNKVLLIFISMVFILLILSPSNTSAFRNEAQFNDRTGICSIYYEISLVSQYPAVAARAARAIHWKNPPVLISTSDVPRYGVNPAISVGKDRTSA